uniref:Uncharacterized protein n=1 Tax=Anopheles funestus TaxID=62324 RepID=A0A182S1X7_ANOFN
MAILSISVPANSAPHIIMQRAVAPIATPFQMNNPKTLNTGSMGLNSTLIIEKLVETAAKLIAIPINTTVETQSPVLIKLLRSKLTDVCRS